MANNSRNRDQEEQAFHGFRSRPLDDSGLSDIGFLQLEAFCKPPRLLVNNVPLNMTINQTLLRSPNESREQDSISSSGHGSYTSLYNRTVAQEAELLANASDLSLDEMHRIPVIRGSTPIQEDNDLPVERITPKRRQSLFNETFAAGCLPSDDEEDPLNDSLEKVNSIIGEDGSKPLSSRRLQLLHDIGEEIDKEDKRRKVKRTISVDQF